MGLWNLARKVSFFCGLTVAAITLAACQTQDTPDSGKAPAVIFPTATTVRVYKGELNLQIASDGTVTTEHRRPGSSDIYDTVPANGGEELTPTEIETVRRSVFYTPPPQAVAACCIPRHAFIFYDAPGHYLGYLKVCFQCGCAELKPEPAHDPNLSYISWDEPALRRVFEAHHLPITTY